MLASSIIEERPNCAILRTRERANREGHIQRRTHRVACYIPMRLVISFWLHFLALFVSLCVASNLDNVLMSKPVYFMCFFCGLKTNKFDNYKFVVSY